MRVLVTGGFGFIGSHALRHLVDQGLNVCSLDISDPSPVAAHVISDIDTIHGDVTDPVDVFRTVADFQPDRIIHLASLLGRDSQKDPRSAFEVNVLGTVHVLEAAETFDVDRVICASSASTYGTVSQSFSTLTEDVPQKPESIYGLTKFVIERIGEVFAKRGKVEFGVLQPVHGLGPDRRRGNVEDASIIKAAVSGTPITVPSIDYPFEVVSVMDEASAFVAAAVADDISHSKYIIGSGEQTTLVDLVETIRNFIPDAPLEFGSERGDDHLFKRPPSDSTRIRDDIGWKPQYTVEETVKYYIDWLRENPDDWSFNSEDVPWGNFQNSIT